MAASEYELDPLSLLAIRRVRETGDPIFFSLNNPIFQAL